LELGDRKSALRTNASLPIPKEEIILTEDQEQDLKDHNILEPTLTASQKLELLQLLRRNQDVFAQHKYDLGCCNKGTHSIDTGNADPIHCNPHQMAYKLRPILKKELDEMLKHNIIEPSTSPWAAPVLMVKKKNGEWRPCVDFRKLNQVAKTSAYPLPKIQDIFTHLHRKRYFTALDMVKGFWQIPLDDASRDKTGFTTHFGQYRFNRLPFGLATSPSAFQHIMQLVLGDLNWAQCMVYVDDILIFSETFEEHLAAIQLTLERLHGANLKVNLKKSDFARSELLYLGHTVNAQGISVDPEKVKAVDSMREPESVLEVESALGKFNYYGRYIDNFAEIARPLFNLKKKNVPWKFGPDERNAFIQLKKALTSAPLLIHADISLPYMLSTDASGYALGAVLSQDQGRGEQPIGYASRTLKDAECRYSGIEREALGIYWAVVYFADYLYGSEFTIYTDHKPLTYLKEKPIKNPRIERWMSQLRDFNFTLEYRKGKDNQNADTLSRYPIIPCKSKVSRIVQTDESIVNDYDSTRASEIPKSTVAREKIGPATRKSRKTYDTMDTGTATKLDSSQLTCGYEGEIVIHPDYQDKEPPTVDSDTATAEEQPTDTVDPPVNEPPSINNIQLISSQDAMPNEDETRELLDNMARTQENDPVLSQVREYVNSRGQCTPKLKIARDIVLQQKTKLFIDDNAVLRIKTSKGYPTCIPTALYDYVFYQSHQSLGAGHVGTTKTLKRAEDRFWFPGMISYLADRVRSCSYCLAHKDPPKRTKQLLGEVTPARSTWERVHMDVWTLQGTGKTPRPGSTTRHTCVIAFVDAFSKYLVAVSAPNHTAATLVKVVLKDLIHPLGVPQTIVSDGAPEFTGKLQQQLFRIFGIARKIVTPYRPQANGNIERVFRTLRPMLAAVAHHDPERWPSRLPYVVYAYNTAYHESIQDTPFHVMFQRDANPLATEETLSDDPTTVKQAQKLAAEARNIVSKALYRSRRRNKAYYDEQSRPKGYQVGEIVMLMRQGPTRAPVRKLTPRWVGPFRIMDIKGAVLYVTPVQYPGNTPKPIHSDLAKPCPSSFVLKQTLEQLSTPFLAPDVIDPNLEAEADE
jgi:hypothetical protein